MNCPVIAGVFPGVVILAVMVICCHRENQDKYSDSRQKLTDPHMTSRF
jgi:hypothetical protein